MTAWDLDQLLAIAAANDSGPLGRPVSIMSFSLNSLLLGASPFSFKLVNLALHLVSGVLLFTLLKTLFSSLLDIQKAKAEKLALICSALWLVHPLLVSTVLYSVQRMAILSSLFMLLGMVLYLRGRLAGAGQGWIQIALSLLFVLPLAIFSKENGVLLLAYLPLLEWLVVQSSTSAVYKKQVGFFWLAFCVAALLGVALILLLRGDWLLGSYAFRDFDLVERLYTQTEVLIFYLGQIFIPGLVPLSFFHDDFPVVRQPDLYTLACAITLLVFLVLSLAGRVLDPAIRFGIAWFLVAHLIESTILPLELVWEHRNYFAAIGPIIILVRGVDYFSSRVTEAWLRVLPLVFMFLCFTSLTLVRAGIWADESALAQHLASRNPDSFRSQSLMAQTHANQGNLEQARNVLAEYSRRQPQNPEAYAQQLAYNCDQVAAANVVKTRLQALLATTTVSNYVMSDLSRLSLIASRGACPAVTAGVMLDLLRSLMENPRLTADIRNAGIVNFLLARNLLLAGRVDEALDQYDVALASDQTARPWRIPLEKAGVLWRLERYAEARELRQSVLTEYADEVETFRFQEQLQSLDRLMSVN